PGQVAASVALGFYIGMFTNGTSVTSAVAQRGELANSVTVLASIWTFARSLDPAAAVVSWDASVESADFRSLAERRSAFASAVRVDASVSAVSPFERSS